jgi:hypothetical protein
MALRVRSFAGLKGPGTITSIGVGSLFASPKDHYFLIMVGSVLAGP